MAPFGATHRGLDGDSGRKADVRFWAPKFSAFTQITRLSSLAGTADPLLAPVRIDITKHIAR